MPAVAMHTGIFEVSLTRYFEAFALRERGALMAALADCMSDDAEIWGPQRLFKGHEAIAEKIEGFHGRMPGARLVLASGLNIFLHIARFKVAIVNDDGSLRSQGETVVELASDGRIQRVFPFWEPAPPLPAHWPAHLAP